MKRSAGILLYKKENNRYLVLLAHFGGLYWEKMCIRDRFNEVSKTHRKIVIMGKGLQDMINKAVDEGYLSVDKSRIGTCLLYTSI